MTRFEDFDFEIRWLWMACDQNGRLAIMHSLGDGAVLRGLSLIKSNAEWLRDWILDELIPKNQGACKSALCLANSNRIYGVSPGTELADTIEEDRQSILAESSCGVFVYEASLGNTFPVGYHRRGIPMNPILLSGLPEKPLAIVEKCCFHTLSFSRKTEIRLEDFGIQSGGRHYPEQYETD